LFVSTIGTVSHVPAEPVTESPNHLLSPQLGGYSASKLICELIIEEHVKSTGGQQRAAICRVGQIAGPALKDSGMWNKQEWLPTVRFFRMGLLPQCIEKLMKKFCWDRSLRARSTWASYHPVSDPWM
jgi:thioester reductase-like protein